MAGQGASTSVQAEKQKAAAHVLSGALAGAGAGAVTGAQVSAGTGPGMAVGAGFGAVAGGIRGIAQASLDRHVLELKDSLAEARQRSQAQAVLSDFYDVRLKWHPTRDIFPADLFFSDDGVELSEQGKAIVDELARLNKKRLTWSRYGVVSYVKSRSDKNEYADHMAKRRALAITNRLIKSGIEPRRIEAFGQLVPHIIFVNPEDGFDRYAQAIEIIPMDLDRSESVEAEEAS